MYSLKPRISEKSFMLSQKTNTYSLDVPGELNKHEIAAAVTSQFDVTVIGVRVVNRQGKNKRVLSLTGKRSSNQRGTRSATKVAYVTLAAGNSLPFFEAQEPDSNADKKSAKITAAKSIVKEDEDKASKETKSKKSVVKKLTGRTKKEAK